MKPLKRVTPELVGLAIDDREPIHIIGQIQPHGLLLALQEPDLTISQISENTLEYFGLPVEFLLGQPLIQIFADETVDYITRLLQDRLETSSPFAINLRAVDTSKQAARLKNSVLLATLHRNEHWIILELESL